jgi:hypothetical protein
MDQGQGRHQQGGAGEHVEDVHIGEHGRLPGDRLADEPDRGGRRRRRRHAVLDKGRGRGADRVLILRRRRHQVTGEVVLIHLGIARQHRRRHRDANAAAEIARHVDEGRGGRRDTRKTMIPACAGTALARKLLIALWRYVTTGELPQGVLLKAA